MRLQQRATQHNRHAIDTFRQTMLRTVNARLCGEPALLTPQTVASFIASHESCVNGFKPKIKTHPHRCSSVMKPRTHAPAPSEVAFCLKGTCARTGARGNQCRESTDYQSHNRVASPCRSGHGGEARRHGGAPRPSTLGSASRSNDPSVRDCYGKSDLPTPTYADVARRTTPQHTTTTTTTTTHAAQTHGVARSMEGMRADVVKLEPRLEPIFAVKKFTQKRKGAKAVKAFEKDAIGSDGKLDRYDIQSH